MRLHFQTLLFVLVLACTPIGCGTIVNLTAPPKAATAYRGMGPTECEPFGGVSRSFMLGGLCMAGGLTGGGGASPLGLLLAPGMVIGGAAILAVDTPLSLVGDVVTLPVVFARMQGAPWATWWGNRGEPTAQDTAWTQFWSEQGEKTQPASEGQAPAETTTTQATGQATERTPLASAKVGR
jgi:uncharacterized protein YceK